MSEKTEIECCSAEGFLTLFNAKTGGCFEIRRLGDSPDVVCQNAQGEILNLEITLTEDRPGDIRALLGRSDDRSLESLRKHLEDVKAGRAKPEQRASRLNGNVLKTVADRIRAKLNKDYGPNTALVVRDTSGVDWDWDWIVDDIRAELDLSRNPFQRGIWILCVQAGRLFQVV